MKMNNNDVVSLTEIKLYFFDPPISFKLKSYAVVKIREALEILSGYQLHNEEAIDFLTALKTDLEESEMSLPEVRSQLKTAGRLIGNLNNR